jgi:integrase
MPKVVKELSDISIKRFRHRVGTGAKNPELKGKPIKAMHAVGGVSGLYLQCLPPKGSEKVGARQWIYRATVGDKVRNIGLGNYPSVPTKSARKATRELQEDIKSGLDPVSEKKAQIAQLKAEQAKELTFEEFARERFIPKQSMEHKGPHQTRRLNQLLRDYVFPRIGNMLLGDIEREDIVELLEPIWTTKNETARRVLQYVHRVIQLAIAKKLREKGNPAVWKNDLSLELAKPAAIHKVKHHRAIKWEELPNFIKALNNLDAPKGSRPDVQCMLFMILTVSRPSEARLVDWNEIDLEQKVWTQPAGKYKSKKMWEIPLCPTAIKILKAQPKRRGRVFSTLNGTELYSAALSSMPDALGFDAVAHGFRATFRTWGQKQKRFTEEELELSLKHLDTVGCRAAYARDQLLTERRTVINAYEKWAMKGDLGQNKKIVSINKRRRAN